MFLRFKDYLEEARVKNMPASGKKAENSVEKFILPYLPGKEKARENSHKLAYDTQGLSAGTPVTLRSHSVQNGVHHATVTSGNKTITVPISKLKKPFTAKNLGLKQEATLVKHLKSHGLMKGSAAGFSAGNDFHLIDKRGKKEKVIRGSAGIGHSGLQGEHKSSITRSAFGQITLHRHPETGQWQIAEESRKKRPEYAAAVEKATVTMGKKKHSLLEHLNQMGGEFHSDDTSLHPAHAYMRDHHVDIVHIDTHGTYRAGLSERKDRHNINLPEMSGVGRFRVRQKRKESPNTRTVQFNIRKLDKSNINIGTESGANEIKKRLGHS